MKKVFITLMVLFLVWVGSYFAHKSLNAQGTDDRAQVLTKDIDPHYKVWFAPIGRELSEHEEAAWFGVQSAVGASVFVYLFLSLRERRKRLEQNDANGRNHSSKK